MQPYSNRGFEMDPIILKINSKSILSHHLTFSSVFMDINDHPHVPVSEMFWFCKTPFLPYSQTIYSTILHHIFIINFFSSVSWLKRLLLPRLLDLVFCFFVVCLFSFSSYVNQPPWSQLLLESFVYASWVSFSPGVRPGINCCLGIWWSQEGVKWPNYKFPFLWCHHRNSLLAKQPSWAKGPGTVLFLNSRVSSLPVPGIIQTN